MAVTSITGGYNANLVALYKQAVEENGGKAASGQTSGVRGGVAPTLSGANFSSRTQKALSEAIAVIRTQTKERITFETVEAYRQSMEKQFSDNLRAALKEKGVDEKIEFKLVADANGDIQVVSNHKDKAMVEQYLKDNPKVVEQFQHIQALSNVQRTAENTVAFASGASVAQIKRQLQAQAVESYFTMMDGTTSMASQIASFNSDGSQASFMAGLNYSV